MKSAPTCLVVHLIGSLEIGGAETMLCKLLAVPPGKGMRHVLVTLVPGGALEERVRALGVEILSLGLRRGGLPLQALWRLPHLLLRLRPDVVQSWMYHSNILGAYAHWYLPRRVRFYWGIRQSLYDLAYERPRTAQMIRLSRYFALVPDAIIYNTGLSAAQHEQLLGYPATKRVMIGNGFDTDSFCPLPDAAQALRASLGISARNRVIGLVGRFDPLKDHRNFLRAAAIARKIFPELIAILAGPGVTADNAQLRETIRALDLEGAVHLLGAVSDMPPLYSAFDVFVSSSLSEGFPNAVGEAMACGASCVVTDVGECAALVRATGRIVPPRDAEALAAAIVESLQLPAQERRERGAVARARIIENYSISSVAREYERLYCGGR